ACKDGTVKLWGTADGKLLFNLEGHAGPVTGVAFSANGQLLATSGSDRTVRFWNPANGQPIAALGAHGGPASAVVINPNNAAAYSAGEDGTVKFWQLPPQVPKPLPAAGDAVTAVALSADGNTVVAASADKSVRV